MRQGQQGKRMRGRGGRKGGSNSSNRSYESNGPDVKVRGTASHIAEKYLQLARDAATSGDPVSSENYLQHAEHYLRIVAASQPPEQRVSFSQNADDDSDDDGDGTGSDYSNNGHANGHTPARSEQPSELAVSKGEASSEDDDSGAVDAADETPAPRRGRGRPRRQNAPKAGAGKDDGDAGTPVVRGEDASSEAPLEV